MWLGNIEREFAIAILIARPLLPRTALTRGRNGPKMAIAVNHSRSGYAVFEHGLLIMFSVNQGAPRGDK